MNFSEPVIFLGMVFIAVFLLMQSFMVPAFGENRQARKRLKQRLRAVADSPERRERLEAMRGAVERSALAQAIESLPGMQHLEQLIEQSGREVRPYRVVLLALALAVLIGLLFGQWLSPLFGVLAGLFGASLPVLVLLRDKARRLARFEEQLPDALMIMSRALRAGHPFSDAMKLVAEEMADPVGQEFRRTFMEINYGGDVRSALGGMLARVSSVTVMVFVTSVMIQKETGGNLAELLDGLSTMIRDRFRFQRKLRTLSAEGRLAAWVLSLLPFALAGVLSLVSPNFLPMLTGHPLGQKMIMASFVMVIIGIFWMRRIVRIDV